MHNQQVKSDCTALRSKPKNVVYGEMLNKFIQLINDLQICAGHPDVAYVQFCKVKTGKFISKKGDVVAHIDSYLPISLNGEVHAETI